MKTELYVSGVLVPEDRLSHFLLTWRVGNAGAVATLYLDGKWVTQPWTLVTGQGPTATTQGGHP
jgi:hypothetical protein